MTEGADLDWFYDDFPRIEEEFQATLDESLDPRGPAMLFGMVERLRQPSWATAVDVGCGEGHAALRLAADFGLAVTGIDPVGRHIELCNELIADASTDDAVRSAVNFSSGTADDLPLPDASVDLVWCRDVLSHVADLDATYREFARVLHPGGLALVYQMFGTDRLEPNEAAWLWETMRVVPSSGRLDPTIDAISASGLAIDEHLVIGTEWGEWWEEQHGKSSRRLLHTARLLREPQRYIDRFGQAAYDGMLGDCLWSTYAMIGKLERHVFVLSPQRA